MFKFSTYVTSPLTVRKLGWYQIDTDLSLNTMSKSKNRLIFTLMAVRLI